MPSTRRIRRQTFRRSVTTASLGIVGAMSSAAPSAHPGMGAAPHRDGTSFRVWAPHAEAVFVTGTFDDWAGEATPL
jgi:1,4-alpha-glucan branching enzyme